MSNTNLLLSSAGDPQKIAQILLLFHLAMTAGRPSRQKIRFLGIDASIDRHSRSFPPAELVRLHVRVSF
jgi:hypothetical protein